MKDYCGDQTIAGPGSRECRAKPAHPTGSRPVTKHHDRKAPTMPTTTRQPGAPRRLRILTAGLGMLFLAGTAGCAAPDQPGQMTGTPSATVSTPGLIEGVNLYEDLSREHVTTEVTYDRSPAVGGAHSPVWTNCGIYTEPVEEMRAVHSMEHGAVWLTYQPGLAAAQIRKLTELVSPASYVVLSPYPGQSSPVTATAWGVQLTVDSPADPRLPAFVSTYIQGDQTPEPGAPCTGGVDG